MPPPPFTSPPMFAARDACRRQRRQRRCAPLFRAQAAQRRRFRLPLAPRRAEYAPAHAEPRRAAIAMLTIAV
jgi:hypothetical protein